MHLGETRCEDEGSCWGNASPSPTPPPNTRDFQKPPEARREKWRKCIALYRKQTCGDLDFELLTIQNNETIHFSCISHPVCGTLL